MKIVPLFYVVMSYFIHTKDLYRATLFDINGGMNYVISPDKKFELIIKFSGLSVNLIYISAFLTI